LGEPVTKKNVRLVLQRYQQSLAAEELEQQYFWGEAIDVSIFYGRTVELRKLQRWVTENRCRWIEVLAILLAETLCERGHRESRIGGEVGIIQANLNIFSFLIMSPIREMEGTWEALIQNADEFSGKRFKLTLLENNESRELELLKEINIGISAKEPEISLSQFVSEVDRCCCSSRTAASS
jgi:hypothetical protein